MLKHDSNLVVVVIIAHKEQISDEEKASLLQCYSVLGKYSIRLICPTGLDISAYLRIVPDAIVEFIDPKWQSNYAMFNKLKIAPLLYTKFINYEYILYYELDAWVFKDEMEYWCNKGYDYIGAPWIETIENDTPVFYPSGCNGGFSLRKVKSHLKVLNKWKIHKNPIEIWEYHKKFHNMFNFLIRLPIIFLRILGYQNNSRSFARTTWLHEDVFWCLEAKKIDPTFNIAPAYESIKFSFEKNPSTLFKINQYKLPFGCHAWMKYEPEFWKQFIHL